MIQTFNTPPALPNLESDSPWSYKGRFGRLSYLAWSFVSMIAIIVILMPLVSISMGLKISNPNLGFLLISIPYLAYFYLQVVFAIRRFHDLDKSGWWAILVFIPLINIIFLLYMLLAKGTDGINNFGLQRPTQLWEKVIGWIFILMIPAIGILAAISIPAYQDYIKRTHAAQLSQPYATVDTGSQTTTSSTP